MAALQLGDTVPDFTQESQLGPINLYDFAADSRTQIAVAGVREIHDCMSCTGSNLEKYYSYRKEDRQTGRLLAAMALL